MRPMPCAPERFRFSSRRPQTVERFSATVRTPVCTQSSTTTWSPPIGSRNCNRSGAQVHLSPWPINLFPHRPRPIPRHFNSRAPRHSFPIAPIPPEDRGRGRRQLAPRTLNRLRQVKRNQIHPGPNRLASWDKRGQALMFAQRIREWRGQVANARLPIRRRGTKKRLTLLGPNCLASRPRSGRPSPASSGLRSRRRSRAGALTKPG